MAEHVIVCGMGQVGHRVVNILTQAGESVIVLTAGSRDDWLRDARAAGVRIIFGDARDEALLAEAGIEDAKALIAVTDLDAINMEIALDSKRLRPDLPVVIRIFDEQLAPQIEAAFGVRRAIGLSTIAAPTFAAVVANDQISSCFGIHGVPFASGRLRIEADSPFAGCNPESLARDWNLAAVTCGSGSTSTVPFARECDLQAGDEVAVVGPMDAWNRALQSTRPEQAEHGLARAAAVARQIHPLAPFGLLADIWRNAPSTLRGVAALLGVLIFLSVFVFETVMRLSFVDALYFAASTVTTTGFGDITPRDAPDGLKLYVVLFMLFGSTTIALLFSMITDFVVTTRFRELSGQNPQLARDHIIVVALGNVGHHVMRSLVEAGEKVVGIEISSIGEFLSASRHLGPVIIGDARLAETLEQAGIRAARGIVAVAPDDATNLAVGLAAKQLNPRARTVVQVADAHLAQKAQKAGLADVTSSAAYLAAPSLVAAALYPNVRHSFVEHGQLCVLVEEEVDPESDGLTAAAFGARADFRPLMIRRPNGFACLPGDELLRAGQHVLGMRGRQLSVRAAARAA